MKCYIEKTRCLKYNILVIGCIHEVLYREDSLPKVQYFWQLGASTKCYIEKIRFQKYNILVIGCIHEVLYREDSLPKV